MEKTIKMSILNEDKKEIIKDIPENLYSNYSNMGWKEYKEKKIVNDIQRKDNKATKEVTKKANEEI